MYLIAILLGLAAGTITGLIPGLHVNNVALICLGFVGFLSRFFSGIEIALFLISMSVMHSFADFIPAIFLGAPDSSTGLGVLPGHKMLQKGRGFEAVVLTALGGLFSVVFGAYFCILFLDYIETTYSAVYSAVVPILIGVSVLSLIVEKGLKKKFWSIFVFSCAGIVGFFVLNFLNINTPLFPMLSGFFGASFLLRSLITKSKIEKQNQITEPIKFARNLKNFAKAIFSSIITSILPGIGAAQAAFISRVFSRRNNKDFLIIIGGINSVSILFMFSVFWFVGKARNGIYSTISNLIGMNYFDFNNLNEYYFIILTIVFCSFMAFCITVFLAKIFSKKINKINYQKINLIILIFILIMCFILSGFLGIYILILCTAIGLVAQLTGIKKTHLMACLIVPVVLWLSPF